MTERPRGGPLITAEQAIARYGSVEAASARTSVPLRDLLTAWNRIDQANKPPHRETPIRNIRIRIPDDLWDQLTAKAGHRGRSALILELLRRELRSP